MLIQFTDFGSIRALLGVSDDELSDDVLILPVYENQLRVKLSALSASLVGDYLTTATLTAPASLDSDFLRSVQLFSSYSVALHLAKSLPMFAPKTLTDGKASFTRFSEAAKEVAHNLAGDLVGVTKGVQGAYAAWKGETYTEPTPTYGLLWVSPPYDTRVTNSEVVRN